MTGVFVVTAFLHGQMIYQAVYDNYYDAESTWAYCTQEWPEATVTLTNNLIEKRKKDKELFDLKDLEAFLRERGKK